jgi:hypothetical protein
MLCVPNLNAQNSVMSGSFSFSYETYKREGVLTLQSRTQKFELPISENILIVNLLPDRYTLIVEYANRGAGGQKVTIRQNVDIESGRVAVCKMNSSAVLSFSTLIDRNSVPVFLGNVNARDNDRHDRRDDIKVVPPPMPQPVSEVDFRRLYNSVQNERFDDTKMRTLKTAANFHEFFTSEQVKQLALLFKSDDDKLECAKYLSRKVLDVQNLPLIKDVFTFSSTKDEYLKFISHFR